MGYSPIDRALEVEDQVTVTMDEANEQSRWYYKSWSSNKNRSEKERIDYKFRPTNYYGGSVCADIIGCNIDCVYCWVEDKNKTVNSDACDHFLLNPQEVVDELLRIADAKNYNIIRLSGGEPTLSRKHLLSIFKILNDRNFTKKFILETNGTLIGNDSSYAKDFRKYKDFLHVRVSLKGTSPESFEIHTGASSEFFELQMNAICNCIENGIDCHAVVMLDRIDTGEELRHLVSSLREIGLTTPLEFERLFLYEYVVNRFNERCIPYTHLSKIVKKR
jgi:uncharacterized Fe-S cluster-containing radical SAM superfamily protein